MRFELSQRVVTNASEEELLEALLRQFKKISVEAKRHRHEVIARKIENTFGSPFRSTRAAVTARPMEGGYLIVADLSYTPTLVFAVAFVTGLFTFILWLVPVATYLMQKGSVRTAIEKAISRVRDEYERAVAIPPHVPTQAPSSITSELEALSRLRNEGVLTPEEFERQKQRVLGSIPS